jgi:hypothetical protein
MELVNAIGFPPGQMVSLLAMALGVSEFTVTVKVLLVAVQLTPFNKLVTTN